MSHVVLAGVLLLASPGGVEDRLRSEAEAEIRALIRAELMGHYDVSSVNVLGTVDRAGEWGGYAHGYGLSTVTASFVAVRNAHWSPSLNREVLEKHREDEAFDLLTRPEGHQLSGRLEVDLAFTTDGWKLLSRNYRNLRRSPLSSYLLPESATPPAPVSPEARIDEPSIVTTEARRAAVIRMTIPREKIREVMGPAVGEVLAAVAAQGLSPAGPVFSHHFRMDPAVFDFEVGVPVATPIAATGRVMPGELPSARVARTVYHGSYEGLGAAWGELDEWIAARGLTPASGLWECYVAGPESSPDPSTWRTELNRPLAR